MNYKKSGLITPASPVADISLQDAFDMLLNDVKEVRDAISMFLHAYNDQVPLIASICYGMTKTIPGFKDQMLKRMSLYKLMLLYTARDKDMLSELGKLELENLEKSTEAKYSGFLETVKLYYTGEHLYTDLLTESI